MNSQASRRLPSTVVWPGRPACTVECSQHQINQSRHARLIRVGDAACKSKAFDLYEPRPSIRLRTSLKNNHASTSSIVLYKLSSDT